MKKLLRVIAVGMIGLVSVGCANAQRQDTIYQTLASDYVSPNTGSDDTWGPVTNIGQGYHQAYLFVTPQFGKTCTTGTSALIDGATRIGFTVQPPGLPLLNITNSTGTIVHTSLDADGLSRDTQILASATTIFPFVYVKVSGIDNVNCKYTLIYTGSLYPVAPTIPTVTIQDSPLDAEPFNPNFNSFTRHLGDLNSHTASVPYAILPDSGTTGINVNLDIYEVIFTNYIADQTVTVSCGANALQVFPHLVVGQVVDLPFTGNFYYSCFGNSLFITQTQTGALGISMIYTYPNR